MWLRSSTRSVRRRRRRSSCNQHGTKMSTTVMDCRNSIMSRVGTNNTSTRRRRRRSIPAVACVRRTITAMSAGIRCLFDPSLACPRRTITAMSALTAMFANLWATSATFATSSPSSAVAFGSIDAHCVPLTKPGRQGVRIEVCVL